MYVLVSVDTTKPGGAAWIQCFKAVDGLQVARHALERRLKGEFPLVHSSHEIDAVVVSCQARLAQRPQDREAVMASHSEQLLVMLHNADDLRGGSDAVTFSRVQMEDVTAAASDLLSLTPPCRCRVSPRAAARAVNVRIASLTQPCRASMPEVPAAHVDH